MKTTFYCVQAEFYDSGEVKACVITRMANKKPNSQYRAVPGMAALKIWLVSESVATELAESIRLKTVDLDDVLIFFSDIKGLEAVA